MLFKRFIFLGACVLLFIIAFTSFFYYSHAQMEDRFRQERENFHADGVILTATEPASSGSVATPSASSAATATPAASDTSVPAASSGAAPDSNIIIGPVPPPSSSSPDSTTPAPAPTPVPTTAPSPADPTSAPLPPSSTMLTPGHLPFWVLAACSPAAVTTVPAPTPAPAVSAPATNAGAANSGATNAAAATTGATNAGTTSSPATNAVPLAAPIAAPVVEPEIASRPTAGDSSVIVLLYHQFKPAGVSISPKFQWTLNADVFESEMKYIHDNGYHVVPLSDVLRFIKHEITLPPGSVAITIDDGYKSAIVYAAPILKKYGYPWTFFIYPQFITVNEGSGAASWNDLLELQKEGVDIECHSMTHPQLTRKGSKTPDQYDAWLTNETAGAKAILEQKMGKPITCFAYPYGDYNKQVEAKVIAAGFEAIFTVADNPVHSTTDLHSIGRYTITQNVVKNFPAYLHQSALSLTKADPEPGATISDPRPIITAELTPMSAGKIDPASIETSVRDFGVVKHDFDPQTNTLRLYLPRDLIQPVVLVNLRMKDAVTGQIMVANWHFNFEPVGGPGTHPPIGPATNSAPATTTAPATPAKAAASTNAPSAEEVAAEAQLKGAQGTPMEPKPATH